MKVRFGGFGGQGIILMGQILGHAAVGDGMQALQTQSYGSSARGGTCHSDVTLQGAAIYEILPESFDILVALSQAAFDQFLPTLQPRGLLVTERDLVDTSEQDLARYAHHPLAATALAVEKVGFRIFANMLTLGFLVGLKPIVSLDSIVEAIRETVRPEWIDRNIKTVKLGYELGTDQLETPLKQES